jgi:hypothetical protein
VYGKHGGGPPTILLTVHQPSHRLLESVAGVVVMGPRGSQLYCGPRRAADGSCALSRHFDGDGLRLAEISANPAEAILEAMGDAEPPSARRLEHVAQLELNKAVGCAEASVEIDRDPIDIVARSSCFRGGASYGAGLVVQMGMLCARHAQLVVRHPLLLWMQLGTTLVISVSAGSIFWQLDYDLDSGVLTRVGLIFFLGLYFMLTALAPLPLWAGERLLYFQERAAGCYGPVAYVLSRSLYDGAMQRVLPAILCAAVVYPMAGLSMGAPSGPFHTALFVASLCLSNLLGTAVITCISIVCHSSGVATMVSVLFVLLSTLFCGSAMHAPCLPA